MRRAGSLLPFPQHYRAHAAFWSWKQPPDPAWLPGTMGLPRSPSAWHLGIFTPELLTRQSLRLKRRIKGREALFMRSTRTAFPPFPFPRLKPYPFPC